MPRRYIIGIGVSQYDDPTLNLPAVPNDVEKVTRWFSQQATVRYHQALSELADSPSASEVQTKLSLWLRACDPEDYVVVYLAAHGEVEGGKAYVQGRDSPRQRLAGVAIEGETLGRIIGQSPPHNVLLIIDACVAGRLGSSVQRSAEDVADELNTRDPHITWTQAVICSTFGRDPAHDGFFAQAFVNVVSQERWTGTTRRYVDFDLLMTGLNAELKSLKVPQVAERKVWGPGAAELIPNPNYGTRNPSALVLEEEFAAHFEPASRGVTRGEAGSYFVGRRHELARISSWLASPATSSMARMMVVTGSPGSGKSALISRAIVLSDRRLRGAVPNVNLLPAETLPPDSSISAAVWCQNKTLEQVVSDIGARLGFNIRTAPALIEAIAARSAPLTVAVDALDEAAEGQSRPIASDLLVPLAATVGVRVLVATRPHPVREPEGGASTTLLDTLGIDPNDPQVCLIIDRALDRAGDMRDYVLARLLATGEPDRQTPYTDRPDLARHVSERVAAAAGTSFLVAGVTARGFAARASVVDDAELERLPTVAGTALASYIQRLSEPQIVWDVLRPLAWSEGVGLPWGPIWAPLATALARAARPAATVEYTNQRVALVLDRASDLIVEAIEWEQPVYRLFHIALAELLRSDVSPLVAHSVIATTLGSFISSAPYQNVPAYVLAHGTSHLAHAGDRHRLYELATSPDWERAKRDRFGESGGFLRDVELAIGAATTPARDIPALAGACIVYARQVAIAPALVISVIAKSGQLERAELMASNLAFAVERCWAYTLVAPTLYAERDLTGANRCLTEAERAAVAINVTHAAMAWAWIAEACVACGFHDRALVAAERAADTRRTLTAETAWETSNVYFWAGLAARRAGDQQTRSLLLRDFDIAVPRLGRNQELQAAAVLGDIERLRQFWAKWVGGERDRGGIVRDGNLALALADIGLWAELEQMLEILAGRELDPACEADSRKHFAWALAIAGRFEWAFRALATIYETEHYLRGLGRIAGEARKAGNKAALEIATGLARRIDRTPDPRSHVVLVPILYDLEQKERALLFAEEIVREGVDPSASTTVAFPEADNSSLGSTRMGGSLRRGKTGRRHLRTDIAVIGDEEAANGVIALVNASKFDDARAKLQSITVPRFRWMALHKLAEATVDRVSAVDLWCDALNEARRVNEPAARVTVTALAAALAAVPGCEAEAERLESNVRAVTKAWTEAEIARQYELLRELLRSGRGRTGRMEELIAASVRSLSASGANDFTSAPVAEQLLWGVRFPLSHLWTGDDVDALLQSGEAGKRIFALVLMESRPSLASLENVIVLITGSFSAFEQYRALVVALAVAADLDPADCARLRAAIEQERKRYITPGTDRFLLSEAILEKLGSAAARPVKD